MKRWLLVALAASLALAINVSSMPVRAAHTVEDVTIPIFAAWGGTASDVDVTYKITTSGAVPASVLAAVQDAIDNWNTAINDRQSGWTFDLVAFAGSPPAKPDISILVKRSGGVVRGTGVPKISGTTGLITGCRVTVAGQFAFLPPDSTDILITAWQEIGHCLGLGHADQPEDPMCSGSGCANEAPTSNAVWHCDADAFVAAHHWLTSGEGLGAHPPSADGITSLICAGSG